MYYAIILPGLKANKNNFWYKKLSRLMQKNGIKTKILDLPNVNFPNYEEWSSVLDKEVSKHNSEKLILRI